MGFFPKRTRAKRRAIAFINIGKRIQRYSQSLYNGLCMAAWRPKELAIKADEAPKRLERNSFGCASETTDFHKRPLGADFF